MSVAEPQDLLELLQRMEYWRQEPAVERKRAFKRFSVRGDASLEPMDTEALSGPLTVMLRDISRGGAGFVCEEYLEPGQIWRMRFKSQGFWVGSQPVLVRFCRLVQNGLYLVGTQFIIEPAILHALGVPTHELANDVSIPGRPAAASEFVDPNAE